MKEQEKFSFGGTFSELREYIKSQLDLLKLKTVAKSSSIVSALIIGIFVITFALIVIFFWALALGFFLGELFGSNALGFLTTGAIFLVIILLTAAFRKAITGIIVGKVIKSYLGDWVMTAEQVKEEIEDTLEDMAEQTDEELENIKDNIEDLRDEYTQKP